jgi:hypothetical protein
LPFNLLLCAVLCCAVQAELMVHLEQRVAAQAAALAKELANSSCLTAEIELLQAYVAELQRQLPAGPVGVAGEQDCAGAEGEEEL